MKKLICMLLTLVMVLGLLPMAAIAGAPVDHVVVAGEEALCGTNWDTTNADNYMTQNADASYTKVYTDVSAGKYSFKVVVIDTAGDANWIGDATGNNITFNVAGTTDVVIDFDATTNEITVGGDGVSMATGLEIEMMATVGNGSGAWLNDVAWDPGNADNAMAEISNGVYQITYADVPAGDNYQFKFAANYSWGDNWGGRFSDFGVETAAVYNSADNITISLAETSTVTITLDLTNFNYATKSGATFTVALGKPVTSVEISGVTAPVAGEAASFDYTIPADAGYEKRGEGMHGCWGRSDSIPTSDLTLSVLTDVCFPGDDLVFEAGYYYTFVAWLQGTDAKLPDDLPATMNGDDAFCAEINGFFCVWYSFYCGNTVAEPIPIENIEITGVTAPVNGAAADFSCVLPEGAGYECVETVWAVGNTMPESYLDVDQNMIWWAPDEDLTFKGGKYYCYIAVVESVEGYEFASDITATINGQKAWVDSSGDGLYIYLPFDAVEGPGLSEIEKVEITVTAPVVGGSASWDFSVEEGANYAGATAIEGGNSAWIVLDEEPMGMDDIWSGDIYLNDGTELVFEEGKCYVFATYLEAEEGYEFADWLLGFVNKGIAMTLIEDDLLFVAYSFGILEDLTMIDNVEINDVTPPSIGADADFSFTIPEDAGYELMPDVDSDFSVWLAGDTAPTGFEDLLELDFFGSEDGLKFEEGKYYTFVTLVTPKDGYGIAYNATGTVNGKEALVQYLEGALFVAYTFEPLGEAVEENTVIESVEINGVTAPALGEGANWNFTVSEGAGYAPMAVDGEALVAWAMSDSKPADMEAVMAGEGFLPGNELTFGADKYYTFVGVLLCEDGYEFSENVTATVNGEDAMVMCIDGMLYVAYIYEPLTDDAGEGEQPGGGEEEIPGGGEQQPGDDDEDGPVTGDVSMAAVAVALMAATAGMALTIGKKKEF